MRISDGGRTGDRLLDRIEAKKRLDRDTHGLVIESSRAGVDPQFADWHYDLRRGRLRLLGGLLRFIDVAHRQGVPEERLQMIPGWISAYIRDLFDDSPRPAAATTKVA